jgi:hypothetical protein
MQQSLVGRVTILFWTCHVLIGGNGFFQGMFQSVTGISTIDSHFVLALPVPQHNWLSLPLIHIFVVSASPSV